MKYYILKDTDEFIRCGSTIEVYREGKWQHDPELLGVYSGDTPIRNLTDNEYNKIGTLN